jgi:hypothetical protein
MLLTITYSLSAQAGPQQGSDARDLGYLLHKNPARFQTFPLNRGKAFVFYPEASAEKCTAALLLDIDPLDLAKGKEGLSAQAGGGRPDEASLFDYVNDRPFVSSSFMSVAIATVYGTALAGRCEQKPVLAETPLELEAEITMLPCRGDTALLEKIFAPLGYEVSFGDIGMPDEKLGAPTSMGVFECA